MFLCFNGSSVQALESNFDDGYFGKNRRAPHTNLSRSEFLVGFYIIFFLRWGWWGWLAGWLVGWSVGCSEEAKSCFFLLVAFSRFSSDFLGPSPTFRCGAAKPRAFNQTWRQQLIVARPMRCALFCGQATRWFSFFLLGFFVFLFLSLLRQPLLFQLSLGIFFYSNEILKLVGGRHVCSLVNDLQYCD